MHDCLKYNDSNFEDDVEYWDVEFIGGEFVAGPFWEEEAAAEYIIKALEDNLPEASGYRVSQRYYL